MSSDSESSIRTLSQKLSPATTISFKTSAHTTSRPSLVFLHYWGGSSSTFAPLFPHLSSYHIIAPDFRGWGNSTGPSSPSSYTIPTLASDTISLLSTLPIGKAGYILIGHSMGGKVSQYIASHPQSAPPGLRGVFLVAPAPLGSLNLPEEMKEQQRHAYDNLSSAEFVIRNVLLSDPTAVTDDIVSALAHDSISGSEAARQAWPAYTMAEDYASQYASIKCPVKIVVGSTDRVETVERVQKEVFNNIPEATKKEMTVLDGIGHLVPVEAAERLIEEIKSFVNCL